MNKRLIILFLVIAPFVCNSQTNNTAKLTNAKVKGERIIWNKDSLLTWDDFKGKYKKDKYIGALSDVSRTFEILSQENNEIKIQVLALFNTEYSWVKPDQKNKELLSHEQFHFNITELYARMLRKELQEIKLKKTGTEIGQQFADLQEKYLKKEFKMQEKYDKETHHHLNSDKQKEWEEKITALLKDYEQYSNSVIVLLRS